MPVAGGILSRPVLAVEVDPRGTNVFLADDIPDSRQPGYDGSKEDLP
jgi:hypothetical protein